MADEIKKEKKTGLKVYLGSFTKEQLIQQIIELNKKYKEVKTYYDFFLNPDSSKKADEVKVTDYFSLLLSYTRWFQITIKRCP